VGKIQMYEFTLEVAMPTGEIETLKVNNLLTTMYINLK
jgi:hypothetical protein